MNYQIITDEKALKEFIDWLPELEPHEKYYLCLFARSKYCKDIAHISSDKAQLKRFTSDKTRMFEKIKQLEIELGAYKQRGNPIPQEAIALYITPNPRNMKRAGVNLMVSLAKSIANDDPEPNCHQEALSQIQKAKSRTCWIDFDMDVDTKLLDIAKLRINIVKAIGGEAEFKILYTRGGVHILINPATVEPSKKKTFYQIISSWTYIDQVGDQMIPIPGTYQGGFTPKFV